MQIHDFFFPELYTEMANAACKPEVLVGFLNFEMGLLEKNLVCTSQPRIGALRCIWQHWRIFCPWDQLANIHHVTVVNISKMTLIHHKAPCDSFGWHHPCNVSAFELMMTSFRIFTSRNWVSHAKFQRVSPVLTLLENLNNDDALHPPDF